MGKNTISLTKTGSSPQYRLITGPGELVTPSDDAAARDAILPVNGFFYGGNCSRASNTTINLAAGKGHVRGREFSIEKTVTINVTPTSAKRYGCCILWLDYKTASPVTIEVTTDLADSTALNNAIKITHSPTFNNESAGNSKDGFVLCTFATQNNAIATTEFVSYTTGGNNKSVVTSVQATVDAVDKKINDVKTANDEIDKFLKEFLVRQTDAKMNSKGYIRLPWGLAVQWGREKDWDTWTTETKPLQQRNGIKFATYTNRDGKSVPLFVAEPIVITQIGYNGAGGNSQQQIDAQGRVKINGVTTKSFNMYFHGYCRDDANSSNLLYVNWIAIGWWKSLNTSGAQNHTILGENNTILATESRKDGYI